MAVICNTEISTKYLNYYADMKWFVTEASALPSPGRVYDDACDVGYRVRSHRTGKAVVFAQHDIQHDNEGDVIVWIYRSIDPKYPVELHVLND